MCINKREIEVEDEIYFKFREVAIKNGFKRGELHLNRRSAFKECFRLFIEKYDSSIEKNDEKIIKEWFEASYPKILVNNIPVVFLAEDLIEHLKSD